MDIVLEYLNNKYFTAAATLASIISLVISIIVLIGMRSIKKHYIFVARVPEILEKLEELASNISANLNDFGGITSTLSIYLAETEINLKSLKRKVNGNSRKSISALLKKITKLDSGSQRLKIKFISSIFMPTKEDSDLNQLYKIHIDLHKVIAEIKDLDKDHRWER